jgi:hypothetical protein
MRGPDGAADRSAGGRRARRARKRTEYGRELVSETQLYGLLRTASWRPTVVSVGHRSTLRIFHKFVLDVAAFNPRCEQLLTGSKSDLDVVTPAFPEHGAF